MQLKFRFNGLIAAVALAALLIAPGCKPKLRDEPDRLRLGVIAGPEEQVAEVARQVAKDRFGLTVDLVTFSDYITPNAALADGSIDANAFQHRPYLERQCKDRGYRLVAVAPTFVYPLAGYSRRIKSLSALRDGAQVAVPNDPTNLGRSLVLLEKQGLISLRAGAGIQATVLDIAANPRKLRIVELDAAQLPRSLSDVDLAVINTTFAMQIDLSSARDGLFVEDKDSPYVNLIVTREDNREAEKVKRFVQAYQSAEVQAAAEKIFKGGVVRGW